MPFADAALYVACGYPPPYAKWLGDADYFSCHGGDMWHDPLLAQHNAFAARLRKDHAAPVGPLLPEQMPGWSKPRPGKKITRAGCVYHGVVDNGGDAPTNDAAIHATIPMTSI